MDTITIMAIDDVIPDRESLRSVAAQRVRRGRLIAMLLAPAMFLLVPVVLLLIGPDGDRQGSNGLVLLLPAVIAAVTLSIALLLARSQDRNPQLIAGADKATRRAVQQALRSGSAPDARVDALTREVATGWLRRTWLLWTYSPLVLLLSFVLVSGIADGDDVGSVLLHGAVVAMATAFLVIVVVNRRRSRRYLAGPPPRP